MNWKSQDEWTRLRAGIGCQLCTDIWQEENEFSLKVIELETSMVRIPWNQYYKGWTVVTLKRHANELFELNKDELACYFNEISQVSKALYEIYNATKINYNIWGSHIPHIHCHLFVMTFQSDPSKPINPHEKYMRLKNSEYEEMKELLRIKIVDEK